MIWLIVDTHFGHERIWVLSGRPCVFEDQIMKNLLRMVGEDDVLIHLDDVCLGKEAKWHSRLMDSTRCLKWLVKGNHDQKSNNWYLSHGWDFICESFSDRYFGKAILFTHAPQRYDTELYDLNIHGHLHNDDHRGAPEDFNLDGRVCELVSMEFTNYRPVSLKSVISSLSKRAPEWGR
jgi:calcineurin-like phosphoesterase family protein